MTNLEAKHRRYCVETHAHPIEQKKCGQRKAGPQVYRTAHSPQNTTDRSSWTFPARKENGIYTSKTLSRRRK